MVTTDRVQCAQIIDEIILMKVLGLEPIFEKVKNPINWINAWTSSKGTQNAPQQTQIDSYNIGSVKSDLNDSAFDDFDF